MDWFMLTVMAIAGWAVVSVLAGERVVRHHQLATAAAAVAKPPASKKPAEPAGPQRAAAA